MQNSYLISPPPSDASLRRDSLLPSRPGTTGDRMADDQWSSPVQCLTALYRRKGTVLLAGLAGVLIATLVSLAQPRLYRSVATLEIQGVNENFLNLRDIDPNAAPSATTNEVYVKTQGDILQQDSLIEQAAQKL